MPLSEQQCRELLEYMRSRVSEAGFGAYDEQAINSAFASEQPTQQLLRYLNEVAQLTSAASGARRQEVLSEMQAWVETRDGSGVTDVRVELSGAQAAFYGAREISLPDDASLQRLARALVEMRDDLAREIEPPTQNRGPRAR